MNPTFKPVKEEYRDYPDISYTCSSSCDGHPEPPKPMEGLHDTGPPSFLTKTYYVVEDPNTNQIVSWSPTGNSFVVWDPQTFSKVLLPKHFKHNNFSSFVRQLNTYGFRKVDPDRWEFANEGFLRGQKHLLKTIKRRRLAGHPPMQQQSVNRCLEVGEFGLEGEVDRLKRDKQLLMTELVSLRQDQQKSRALLSSVEERLHATEQRQELTMTFIARLMGNPNFLQHLIEQKEKMKEIEDAISRKRRRPIDRGPENDHAGTSASQEFHVPVKMEVQATEDFMTDGFSSVEGLTGMQGFINKRENKEEHMEQETSDGELNDEFWEELLHEGIGDDKGGHDNEETNRGDVKALAGRLHILRSTCPE